MRCYHFGPEWTWERWHWKDTQHSPKLQHYWSLNHQIVWCHLPGHLLEDVTPLQRCSRCFVHAQRTGQPLFLVGWGITLTRWLQLVYTKSCWRWIQKLIHPIQPDRKHLYFCFLNKSAGNFCIHLIIMLRAETNSEMQTASKRNQKMILENSIQISI